LLFLPKPIDSEKLLAYTKTFLDLEWLFEDFQDDADQPAQLGFSVKIVPS